MVVASSVVCAGHAGRRPWATPKAGGAGLVERANLALLDASLDLSVVVPYYNPGRLLVPTIERLLSVLDASGASYEVVAVSDGSTDGSDRRTRRARGGPPPADQPGLRPKPGQGRGPAHRPGPGPGTLLGLHRRRRGPGPDPARLVPDHGPPLQPGHHPRQQAPPALGGRVPTAQARLFLGLPAGGADGVPSQHPRHPDRDQAHTPGRAVRRAAPHGGEALRLRPGALRDRPPPRLQAVPRGPYPPAPPVHEHGVLAFGLPFAPRHPGHLVPAPASCISTTATRARRHPGEKGLRIDPVVLRGSAGPSAKPSPARRRCPRGSSQGRPATVPAAPDQAPPRAPDHRRAGQAPMSSPR